MKSKFFKKILCILTTGIMLCAVIPVQIWADYVPEEIIYSELYYSDTDYATRSEVVEMLLSAADNYNPEVKQEDIMKGYDDGTMRGDNPISRVESFVMAARAFGTLPTPIGNNLRISQTDLEFSDIPDWAVEDINKMASAGILIGTEDGLMSPDEYVTTKQMHLVISRFFRLFGSNIKDDFYAAANKNWLDSSVIPDGFDSSSYFSTLDLAVTEQINEILDGIIKNDILPDNSEEQKIKYFYQGLLNVFDGKDGDLSILDEYSKKVDNAKNIDELFDVSCYLSDELSMSKFLDVDLTPSSEDSNKYIMVLFPNIGVSTNDLYDENGKYIYHDEFYSAYTEFLKLSGEDEESAAKHAGSLLDFESLIGSNSFSSLDFQNLEKINNIYTAEQIQEMIPAINIKQLIENTGYAVPEQIQVYDIHQLETFAKCLNNKYLEPLKSSIKISLIRGLGNFLDIRVTEITQKISMDLFGISGETDSTKLATSMVKQVLPDYLGKMYVNNYFSEDSKKDIIDMCERFISIYKEKIMDLSWMGENTKKQAIKKLDTMNINVGYSDNWNDVYDNIELVSPEQPNSAYLNCLILSKANMNSSIKLQNEPVDKSQMPLPVYTVNAFYLPTANSIVFPAGILQDPFYDPEASDEQNYGAIGVIIAHEISHAFDNNGSQYDENGNANDWWQPEDYDNFKNLCQDAIDYYTGSELAPGIVSNGELTLSENIADLGGISCALKAISKKKTDVNYDEFFKSYATIWCNSTTRSVLEYYNKVDFHSNASLRVNLALPCFEEFYDTYHINPDDGMYIAPENRISIW